MTIASVGVSVFGALAFGGFGLGISVGGPGGAGVFPLGVSIGGPCAGGVSVFPPPSAEGGSVGALGVGVSPVDVSPVGG